MLPAVMLAQPALEHARARAKLHLLRNRQTRQFANTDSAKTKNGLDTTVSAPVLSVWVTSGAYDEWTDLKNLHPAHPKVGERAAN
jgi:hypothetical protein